jgi:PTH1 family peptidyl-tRNA hydrolase
MVLIVGLGNPGNKFKKTRHNFGFKVIEEFQKKYGFPKFRLILKLNSNISQKELFGKKIILAKPQTFMNSSGIAIKKLIQNFKLPIFNLWVIHDDISLPLGQIRISKSRGSAGHKGVESIIKELETKDFVRFRLGIKSQKFLGQIKEFVLQKFDKKEEKIVKEVIKKTISAIEFSLKFGLKKAMQEYNK